MIQLTSWVGDFEKKIPASACRKKEIACSTNVIESVWEKRKKKYPTHQIARKKTKFLMTRNQPHHPQTPPRHHPPPAPQELNGRPLTLISKIQLMVYYQRCVLIG